MTQPDRGPQNTGYITVWGSLDDERLAIWNISKLGNITSVSPESLNSPMVLGFVPGGYKYIVQSYNHPELTSFTDTSTSLKVSMEDPYIFHIDGTTYRVYRSSYKLSGSIKIEIN